MSGHSKWAQIKRKKAVTDAARGKAFSRVIKEITMAARGGGDPDMNPRLRTAIAAAKAINMPAANIERAIQRGSGASEGSAIEEVHYEGYGPAGVAVLVECATDNRNRMAGEIRHMFTKYASSLGEAGSVSYLFKPRGVIVVERSAAGEDALMEAALDAGADDVVASGDSWDVLTPPAAFEAVKDALAAHGIPVASAELTRLATVLVPVTEAQAESVLKLVEALEDMDDVQRVFVNFEPPESVLARLVR